MADVIMLADHLSVPSPSADAGTSHEEFLINEGLDLLAAYRAIKDRNVRLSIKRLVEDLARRDAAEP